MKKIGVIVHQLAVEYTATVINGIYDYFKDKDDVSVIITQTRQPGFNVGIHEYQYWASAELFKSECFDALIVISSSYLSTMSKIELEEIVSQFKSKIIVSIGVELDLKNSYCTVCKPFDVYINIVKHLKEEHGCKKIGFLSANLVQTQEGADRFEAYKQALEKNDLEFNPDFVFDSNFTNSCTRKVLKERIKKKEDVKFDSIICANDIMATAVIDELSKFGLRIPEDIKVFGFDNTSHASLCVPPISTVDQQIELQGYLSAEMAYKILQNEKVEKKQFVPLKIIYRESCGCQDYNFLFQNQNLNSQINNFNNISKVDVLLDSVSGVYTMESFVECYKDWIDNTCFDSLACCIYDEPIPMDKNQIFYVPETARLLFHIDFSKGIEEYYEKGKIICPREILFPDDYWDGKSYLFQPLFLGDKQYGYLMCRFSQLNFAINSISLQILTSTVLQAYEYTLALKNQEDMEKKYAQLLDNNKSLKKESVTDELSQLFNRRGYLKYAQKMIDVSIEMGTMGLVFFADLDGLKTINDTYGHEYGDLAIQTISAVFKKAFRQSDVIGRLSGDEFSIVTPGMNLVNVDPMKKKIKKFCKELSKEKGLPFVVSISMGAVPFTSENNDVQSLLHEADSKLYEEKKIKHAER